MQLAQFLPSWKLAEPQQIARLLEIGVVGQFMDVNAAIGEHATVAVDVADLRIRGNDALEPLRSMSCSHAGHSRLAGMDFCCRAAQGGTRSATSVYT